MPTLSASEVTIEPATFLSFSQVRYENGTDSLHSDRAAAATARNDGDTPRLWLSLNPCHRSRISRHLEVTGGFNILISGAAVRAN